MMTSLSVEPRLGGTIGGLSVGPGVPELALCGALLEQPLLITFTTTTNDKCVQTTTFNYTARCAQPLLITFRM